ncbi:hypothetical protein L1049_025925 [Liquidambar formosana]|uniref:SET domain-containing protein n=1 Tax=Liquidambar formosana TaxID=63359 RepID=A0AAP0R8R3_LIQFO
MTCTMETVDHSLLLFIQPLPFPQSPTSHMKVEMEMEMKMIAREDISIGEDITPALQPLASSLYDSHLLSHCSSCFSPLPSPPLLALSLFYCSSQCSDSDSPLHLSSAEHHLLSTSPAADTSDLRLSLRLLHSLPPSLNHPRIRGLLTNRDKLMYPQKNSDDDEILTRIRDGARAMAMARRIRDGEGVDGGGEVGEAVVEEAMLCLVLTNAVEVQVHGGQTVGIAVYGTAFSWINHSCSPNACYRFLTSAAELPPCSVKPRLRIAPSGGHGSSKGNIETEINSRCFIPGSQKYGPRIVVRSIKAIKKGEEVTMAYTDLLKPKAVRQSELWLKYRFICCCSRCSVLPPTYVDHTLQEILASKHDTTNLSSYQNFYQDEAVRKMLTDYVDDAITEYLSVGNPESCCDKLENMLVQGLSDEQLDKERQSRLNFRLHPLHHLSLNAYTTLASAYKIRASHLLAFHPETEGHQLEAFNMSRTSAAYSLLLAGATHHLFLSESSLIASVSNFWMSAGESLLSLARSSAWNLFVKWGWVASNFSSFPSQKCYRCSLMAKFEANFSYCEAQNTEFEDITREFLDCIRNFMPTVWSFLIHGCHYLKVFKDPIDLSWLGTIRTSVMWDFQGSFRWY